MNMKLDEVARLVLKLQAEVEGNTYHARINQLEDRLNYVGPLLRELETKVGQLAEDIRVLKELVLPKPDPETIGYGGDS